MKDRLGVICEALERKGGGDTPPASPSLGQSEHTETLRWPGRTQLSQHVPPHSEFTAGGKEPVLAW